jgi:cytochrome P450
MSDGYSQDSRTVVSIDIESTEHARSWEKKLGSLRAESPVAWSTELGGFWAITRYRDVVAVAQDDATFTSGKTVDPLTGAIDGGIALPPMPIPRVVPDETDRGEWEGFRHVLNPRVGPRVAREFRGRALYFANALIDRAIERGEMDFVQDYTSPLTALVTMDLVGFPLNEWRDFADPLHMLVFLEKASPEFPAAVAAMQAIDRRIDEEIERCRAEPTDSLIGHLVAARIAGAPMRHEDMHQMVFNVLSGGVDTTTALTSNTLIYLHRHHAERAKLIADPSLLPAAREEFVRFFSPVHGTARTVRAETSLGGQVLSPGERVFLFWASANRDSEIFDQPDIIDITRAANRHVGFGAGIHRCVGSFVARMMFDVMVEAVLERLPDYVILEQAARPYPSVSPINGWIDLPATFTPGRRKAALDPAWL